MWTILKNSNFRSPFTSKRVPFLPKIGSPFYNFWVPLWLGNSALLNYIMLFKPKVVYRAITQKMGFWALHMYIMYFISYLHQIWESRSNIQNVVDWRTSCSISVLMTFSLTKNVHMFCYLIDGNKGFWTVMLFAKESFSWVSANHHITFTLYLLNVWWPIYICSLPACTVGIN